MVFRYRNASNVSLKRSLIVSAFVILVFTSLFDTSSFHLDSWYSSVYNSVVVNRLSQNECDQGYQKFISETINSTSAYVIPNIALSDSSEIDFNSWSRDVRDKSTFWAFIHQPKAGGTSLEDLLIPIAESAGKGVYEPISHCRRFLSFAEDPPRKSQLFRSRRPYGVDRFLPSDHKVLYIMNFRHPIDRIQSYYYHEKTTRWWKMKYAVNSYVRNSRDLEQYLTWMADKADPRLDNYAVKQLVHLDFPEIFSYAEDCCGGNTDLSNVPPVTEEHFRKANETLYSKIGLITVVDDLSRGEQLLKLILTGSELQSEMWSLRNPHPVALSDWAREELQRRNTFDLMLYGEAQKIYKRQIQFYEKLASGAV